MNDLQKLELDILPEEQTGFVVNDLETLNWVFRKISAMKAQIKENSDLAAAERQRIDQWELGQNKALKQSVEFFEFKAQEYHEQLLQQDPKKKSISTPYGKVKSTTRKASLKKPKDVTDLLNHIELLNPELVKVTKDVKWDELKKTLVVHENSTGFVVVDENGEIVPGVTVEPASTTFKVEVGE